MGINVLYLFLTGVFLWSLMRIKFLIERVNTRNSFQTNKRLLWLNLVSFSAEFILFLIVFVVTVVTRAKSHGDLDTQQDCRLFLSDTFFYTVLWSSMFFRLCLTSYMNVKQSRSKGNANRQFLMVFNQTMNEVGRTVKENDERDKASRRDKFYKEYADM